MAIAHDILAYASRALRLRVTSATSSFHSRRLRRVRSSARVNHFRSCAVANARSSTARGSVSSCVPPGPRIARTDAIDRTSHAIADETVARTATATTPLTKKGPPWRVGAGGRPRPASRGRTSSPRGRAREPPLCAGTPRARPSVAGRFGPPDPYHFSAGCRRSTTDSGSRGASPGRLTTRGGSPDGPSPDGPAPDGPAPDGPAPDGPPPLASSVSRAARLGSSQALSFVATLK